MGVKNKVQLITYPDSMGGNLPALDRLLEEYFPGLFQGGIHILPPFPSSGDRGFAPTTYFEIDPRHGSWEDIRRLGGKYDILLDLMVNHISRQSVYFQDFLKRGEASEYAAYFLFTDKLWPGGVPVQEDIDKMFLRREQPYSEFTIQSTGETKRVWTTFGKCSPSEQIDFDIEAPAVRKLFSDIFACFADNGVKIVRLDAVGYVIKKLGTTCFFVEPDIYGFLDWIKSEAEHYGLELLSEVHAEQDVQYRLAEHGYWIYDFILPYVVLDTLTRKSNRLLYAYLKDRPEKQFTMLDCHDGIPVKPDLDGVVSIESIRETVALCAERGATFSKIVSEKQKGEGGFDVHQIRGAYYSLLGGNDDAYILARAIQFFVPGIPQVYYVGLLAGENDLEAVERTGEGREINRHNFTEDEVAVSAGKDVVARFKRLIALRNRHEAFDGAFRFQDDKEQSIRLEWNNGAGYCYLTIDLAAETAAVRCSNDNGGEDRIKL